MTVAAAITVVNAKATAKIANIFFMVVYSHERHHNDASMGQRAL